MAHSGFSNRPRHRVACVTMLSRSTLRLRPFVPTKVTLAILGVASKTGDFVCANTLRGPHGIAHRTNTKAGHNRVRCVEPWFSAARVRGNIGTPVSGGPANGSGVVLVVSGISPLPRRGQPACCAHSPQTATFRLRPAGEMGIGRAVR